MRNHLQEYETLTGISPPRVNGMYDCLRATRPPALDGDLSDECWSNAPWAEIRHCGFVPGLQSRARAKLLWDDVCLYFAVEITDATPRCMHKDRDSNVWEDDCFEIYLSPNAGSERCYELDFNSAGAIFDALRLPHHSGREQILRSWTAPSLEVNTRAHKGGWTIEGRIRLDEFIGANYIPPKHDDRWRMNLFYLDAPREGGKQAELAWNPTEQFEDVSRFGVLRFVDYEGHSKDQRDQELAQFFLTSNRLTNAVPLIKTGSTITVSSKEAGAYQSEETGWHPKTGYGRVTALKSDKGELPVWRMQPNSGTDPTLIDLVAERDGLLVVLGRMTESSVAGIEQGEADGVWISARVKDRSNQIHLSDSNWRATSLDVRKGDPIHLIVDAGPAQNVTSDNAEVGVLLAERSVLDPGLPQGWRPFGGVGLVGLARSENNAIRVTATDHFSGAQCDLPLTPGARLYKITGQFRSELMGTTRGHVGIDFLDKDRRFIRQASTPVSLQDHLRWGLHNFGGTNGWSRFVAHAYDVPTNAAIVSLWLGVNAWNAPDASGRAWFADINAEAVEPDAAFPLGFPPLQWTPEKRSSAANHGYILSRTPITTYQLPTMPSPRQKDDRDLEVLAWPDSAAPVSFSIHALGELGDIRVEVSDLIGKSSKPSIIPSSRIDVRKVFYLWRKRDLMINSEYLLSPNHLEPFESLTILPNQTQQCWLTIHVPIDAAAGRYQGSVRIVSARAGAKSMKLTLDVAPIQPRTRPGLLLGMYSCYMKNETPVELRAMLNDMRAHGMTTTFHFNGGIKIPIEGDADGRAVIRWDQPNPLRELFDAYRDAGFTEPMLLIAPDAIFNAAREFGGDKEFGSVYRDLFEQVRAEGAKRKWPPFVVAPYDEGYPYSFADVRFERTRACAPALRAAGLPIALHALNHPTDRAFRFEREFENWTDVNLLTFCHSPACGGATYRGYESWSQYRDAMRSKRQRVLFYNPDTTGVHPEAMRFIYGVGLWRLQADGVIDWHYGEHTRGEAYKLDPKQGFVQMDFVFPAAGGHAGGPTIGWEAAREGVKDFQLLYTLDRLVGEARQSTQSDLRRKAERASREVNLFLDRFQFDSLDPTSALSLGQWDAERVDEHWVKHLHGQFKIRNGFAMEDYDIFRRLVCDWILELNTK